MAQAHQGADVGNVGSVADLRRLRGAQDVETVGGWSRTAELADADARRAFERLSSLHEGYAGVTDVVRCGRRAIPAIGRLLARADSSGIFELRCRAIMALAALGAHDVLIEFLKAPKQIVDPTARAGEEAVISTAARALIGVHDCRVFHLLLELANQRPLAGVIEALGTFRRPEAIPGLINGLYEDHTRGVAATALRSLGGATVPALLGVAMACGRPGRETDSGLRARRCAIKLLAEIGISSCQRDAILGLVWDPDPEIAVQAARACLGIVSQFDRDGILARLDALLPRLRAPTRRAAPDCLAIHRDRPTGAAPAAVSEPPS